MGLPEHLTYLLRNLYAGQEATVRTGHETRNWFQIGKGVHQGCILSPCLFNLNAEKVKVKLLSRVRLFATPWTVAYQAPVHGISQAMVLEWVAFPSPGDLPNPGIEPRSPTLQADALPSEPPGKPQKRQRNQRSYCQHPLDYRKSKGIPEKPLLLLH